MPSSLERREQHPESSNYERMIGQPTPPAQSILGESSAHAARTELPLRIRAPSPGSLSAQPSTPPTTRSGTSLLSKECWPTEMQVAGRFPATETVAVKDTQTM